MPRVDDIRLRRGSLADWVDADPVLNAGEVGLILDEFTWVVGNGVDAFTSLPKWAQIGPAGPQIVGMIVEWALPSLPSSEWLWCDGSAVTSAHPQLRNALLAASSPYGVSGSDPKLPDKRGRVAVGLDAMGGTSANRVTSNSNLGNSGGWESHTLTIEQIPSHAHSLKRATSSTNNNYLHAYGSTYDIFPTGGTGDTGGGGPHNNMQPYLAVGFIIYAGVA